MMFNKRRRLHHSSRVKLSLVRHYLKTAGRAEIADIEQMEKTVPLITWEVALCQYVCELVFGVVMFDLDFGIEVDSVTQPIWRDLRGSCYVSHHRTPSFDDHLDHCLVVFKMYNCASHWAELAFVVTWSGFDNWSTFWLTFFVELRIKHVQAVSAALLVDDFLLFDECNTSITTSHKSRAGNPSIRKTSIQRNNIRFCGAVRHWRLSVELWDTDVCFLHIELMGTNARISKIHKTLPRGWFWVLKVASKILVLE